MSLRLTVACLAALVECAGCSPKSDILARVRSPDGHLDAIVAQPRTDATVGFVSWVYVVPAGQQPNGEPLFIADHVVPQLDLHWSADGLEIHAQRARVFKSTPQIRTGSTVTRLRIQVAEQVG